MKKIKLFGREFYVLTKEEKGVLDEIKEECDTGMLAVRMVRSGAFDHDPIEIGALLADAHDCFVQAKDRVTALEKES